MTILLHQDAKTRLLSLLEDALDQIRVTNNSFLHWPSPEGITALDRVVPARSDLAVRLSDYIGEEAVSDFVIGRLSDGLIERAYESGAPRRSLPELDGYEDLTLVAEGLLTELESLPWRYRVFTPIPWELGQEIRSAMASQELWLSKKLRIVAFDAGMEPELQREPDETSFGLDAAPRGVRNGVVYLGAVLQGYIPRFGDSAPLQEYELNVRAFFGLTVALRIAEPGMFTFFGPSNQQVLIFRDAPDRTLREHAHELPQDTADAIRGIGVGKKFKAIPDDARPVILKDELQSFLCAFGDRRNERILRAARWLFDSYATKNRTLSFVQATVAVEILFGEKAISDVIGLGELLGNRVAYLIGTTRQSREKILADFRRIYRTRSRIVHSGHSRLSVQERKDLAMLRWMASRSLRRELELSLADKE